MLKDAKEGGEHGQAIEGDTCGQTAEREQAAGEEEVRQPHGYYEDRYGPMVLGAAEPSTDTDSETEYPVAIIYLPDPSERTGLVCRWVKRQKTEIQRKAGYRL